MNDELTPELFARWNISEGSCFMTLRRLVDIACFELRNRSDTGTGRSKIMFENGGIN